MCCQGGPSPDFSNFWRQSLQQGFHPKVPSMTLAIGFPDALRAPGESGLYLMGEGGFLIVGDLVEGVGQAHVHLLAAQRVQVGPLEWGLAIILAAVDRRPSTGC